ncbi:MAG: hypothetical protein ABF381_15600, partial [Akkermansiaceae bacterium]
MLVSLITAEDPATRDRPLAEACATLNTNALLQECSELDTFRRASDNLYHRVRAIFFLQAIHRFHLPERLPSSDTGSI